MKLKKLEIKLLKSTILIGELQDKLRIVTLPHSRSRTS